MPKALVDTFADLPVSRQRKYQFRKRLMGRCTKCGGPSNGFTFCDVCAQVHHYAKGAKRFNSLSPRIKAKLTRIAKAQAKRNPWIPKGER